MMLDDDDPKTPAPAPEGAPADDQVADEKPEGDEPEGDDAEQKASTDDEEAADEDEEQDDEELDDDEEDDGDKPKRKASRAQRYKRRAERAEAEAQALRSRSESGSLLTSEPAAINRAIDYRVWQEVGDPPDRNDPKYRDNYVQFERDVQGWDNDRRQVTREVRKEFANNIKREQDRVAGLVAEHKERVARLSTKVKDFDTTMARATVPVALHVERQILESKRSDRIMWHLARDQAKLVKLNNMSSEAVAREIGRIEGRLSLPQPKQQTKARKPITPLRGGGTSPPTGMAAVNAWMKKQYGDRK